MFLTTTLRTERFTIGKEYLSCLFARHVYPSDDTLRVCGFFVTARNKWLRASAVQLPRVRNIFRSRTPDFFVFLKRTKNGPIREDNDGTTMRRKYGGDGVEKWYQPLRMFQR